MFIAYNCDGCSTASLRQYENNKIYQEITQQDEFATDKMDDRLYIDTRRSQRYTDELEKLTRNGSGVTLTVNLKEEAKKKMKLRVVGYSQAEYWYALSNKGYIMTYKNYNISKNDNI